MRIISQDGLCDYPYEHCVVFVNNEERTNLCISMCGDGDADDDLAEYNSEEDALFVMKQIRRAANDGYTYYFMPSAKEVERYK